MATKTNRRFTGKVRDDYLECIMAFPLASISSASQLKKAQKVIDRLFVKGHLSAGEDMYLDALGDLVAAYEDEHHAIAPATDADLLRHLMDAKGVSQAQLSREANVGKSTISEILSGKKRFSRGIIRKLATYFCVDASILSANP